MSCNDENLYEQSCCPDTPYPTVQHESVPSLIDNLVDSLYGTITKTVSGGKVVWDIPCDPANDPVVFPSIPRLEGEGLLCYLIRCFNQFITQTSYLHWTFTGNGATGFYNLPGAYTALPSSYLVYIDGVVQVPTTNYTIVNNPPNISIDFTTPIPNGSVLSIVSLGAAPVPTDASNFTVTPTGSGTSDTLANWIALFGNGNIFNQNTTFLATGTSFSRNLVTRFSDTISVKDFGAVGDGVTDDTGAIQAAINSIVNQQSSGRAGGTTLFFPEGIYLTSASIVVDNVNLHILGNDARINHSGSGPCFLVGNASYLTNLALGYFVFRVEKISIYLSNAAATGIRNNGYRRLQLAYCYISGGLIGLETEGAWSGSEIVNTVCQSQTGAGSIGFNIKQRNNLMRFMGCAALSFQEIGFLFSTVNAELGGLFLQNCDAEGTATGYKIDGHNIGTINFTQCWGENNTAWDIDIPNTTGTLKQGISIVGGDYGKGIRIGTPSMSETGSIRGFHVSGTNFGGGSSLGLQIYVDSGVTVGQCIYGSPATLIFHAGQSYGGSENPSSELLNRYQANAITPNSSEQGGNIIGDIRWRSNRLFVSTGSANPFWQTAQLSIFRGPTSNIPNLPAGTTPDVSGIGSAITANSGATTITNFVNGFTGQEIKIVGSNAANTTIAHGTNIRLPSGASILLGEHDVVHLVCRKADPSLWVCVSYSNNS